MPFGFANHLKKSNISNSTIAGYVEVVNQFFSYLDSTGKENLELYEISIKHVKLYLKNKKKTCTVSTLNKHITVLKKFFDYLWHTEQIVIDPISKIKTFKKEPEEPSLNYEKLLAVKNNVFNSDKYNLRIKVVFLFALRGATYTELKFTKDQVTVGNDEISVSVTNKQNITRVIKFHGEDADLFHSYYTQSLFYSTPYVFISKRKKTRDEYGFIDYDVLKDSLKHIREVEEGIESLTLTTARTSYIIYLHEFYRYSVNQISDLLGINKSQIGKIIDLHNKTISR